MHFSTRTRRRLRATVAALTLLLAATTALSWHDVTHTRLAHLDLTSPKVHGRALKVMQITDVHDRGSAAQRAAIVAMVEQQRPDLIALTGDLVSVFTKDPSRMEGFITQLTSLGIPTYYVPGNHENLNPNPGDQAADVQAMVARHGVTVLLNRNTPRDGPWGRLDVIGTDDYYTNRGNLAEALRGTRADAYHLVLTHSPGIVDDQAALPAGAVDLAICGHTHGGQVRIPGIGALYAPGGGFLPTYDQGLFHIGNSQLYVDSGVGQSFPLRLFDQSQVTLITVAPGR